MQNDNQATAWGKKIAIAVSVVMIACSSSLHAAVIDITQGSTSGFEMTDGNTYVIRNSVTFTNSVAGGSGMSVANNATVVLCIPQGVILTAIGANGRERTGGGAGIRVPSTSTLIITGEGTVIATGGNAGDGADGSNGTKSALDEPGIWVASYGVGGSGGNGGGGAGAGIGGIGGIGGFASSGNGGDGESMGDVYVLGCIRVESHGGLGGAAGSAGALGSSEVYFNIGGDYILFGGSGGGGGGAGSPTSCSIGGGGSGGGAGGRGENGKNERRNNPEWTKQGGGGGSLSETGKGGGASTGGAAGSEGGLGVLYLDPNAIVEVERSVVPATTHPSVQYVVTFEGNGGTIPLDTNAVAVTLGRALPECIPTPVRRGYLFSCWEDCNGIQYYGNNGEKMLSSYLEPSNVTLYADWQLDPGRMVITPADGTVFTNSLTVSMSSSVEGSTIRYTTDGSDPTCDSPIYKKSKISGKTTFKAIAFYDDGNNSEVVTASYALGQCADPMISPADGHVFNHSGLIVSIDQKGEEGVLRYTIDGSDPTSGSPTYSGPFAVDDSTVVKAKVFSDRYFDSAVVTVNLTRDWETVATPVITATSEFTGLETKVVIGCATPGATIRYTTNGSDPTSHSPTYTGPFWVNESSMVKAVAMCAEYLTSAVATHTITKVWGIGDTMGVPDHSFATSGNVAFSRVVDASAPCGEAMRSGAIGNSAAYGLYTRSVLSTTVQGPGTLTFKWRSSCEQDDDYEWDHAEFAVDGVVKARINDVTEWREVTQDITGEGEHVITWTYLKDSSEEAGEDCLWVSGYSWVTDEPYTHETATPVPYDWIRSYLPHTPNEYDHYESVAREIAANGVNTVEEAYVAGLNPTNENSKFTALISFEDGEPKITWTPDLSEDELARSYTTYGKTTLDASEEWRVVTDENKPDMRFFKVLVELPKKD